MNITFLKKVPDNFYTGRLSKYMDLEPVQLPADKYYIARKDVTTRSYQDLLNFGVTNIHNGDLPWHDHGLVGSLRDQGVTYNGEPNTQNIFGLGSSGPDIREGGYWKKYWPDGPLNEIQARIAANSGDHGDHNIWIGQNEEGDFYMPSHYSMWGWFYDELKNKLQARSNASGKPYLLAHNYFWIGKPDVFRLGETSRQAHKDVLTGAAAIPSNQYSPGSQLQECNLLCEGIYNNGGDFDKNGNRSGSMLKKIYMFLLFKKMGKKAAGFLQSFHEWRPNNFYYHRIADPAGDFYVQEKIPLAPNFLMSAGFMTLIFGDLYYEWGHFPSDIVTEEEAKWFYPSGLGTRWKAQGETEFRNGAAEIGSSTYPYFRHSNGIGASAPAKGSDFSHLGVLAFSKTFAKVNGAPWQFCRFRIDGGAWIEPENATDGTDIVDAHFDRRGICVVQKQGSKVAMFYYNEFADNQKHTLEFQVPGESGTHTASVCSDHTHAAYWE